MSSAGSRIADVLHKTLITGLAGLTVLGAVEVTSEVNFLNRRRAQRRAEAEAAARSSASSDASASTNAQ